MGIGATFGKNKQDSNGSYTGLDKFNQTSNFTTSPTNPEWEGQLAKTLGGDISTLRSTDPKSYVAGPTPLLTTAANAAGDLSGTPWSYDAATDVTRGVANSKAPDIASKIGKFLDPYLSQVVDATKADLDQSDNIARQTLDLQDPGAFGGSGRYYDQMGLTRGQDLARGLALGGLRSAGYSQALGGATSQAGLDDAAANRKLAAGQQIANIADQYGATQRADIATQVGAAQPIQAINQAQAQAPLDFQSFLTQLMAGLPLGLFQGQTGTEDQSGTETQSGTTEGKVTGLNAGFGFQGGK
jgi:hypothetical protein